MIPRLCHSKFKPENYKLPSVPQHGKNKLVTTKLCEQLYRSPCRYDFDATTPREYMKPALMEYNSLYDPHLKSYFYRPDIAEKLVQNGFVTEDLDVLMPLRTYNIFRKFMENEFLRTHRQKAEEQEPRCSKIKLARKAAIRSSRTVNHEREEKRRRFLLEQEQAIQLRKMKLEDERNKEIQKKEEEAKLRKIAQEKLEAERDAEREKLQILKFERTKQDYMRRKKLYAKEKAMQDQRLTQLKESRQKQREDHFIKRENLLKQHKEHHQLLSEKEEEQKAKIQQLKLERLKHREELYLTLQHREEEKKKKLMEFHRRKSVELKEEADQFERHWKELHDHEIEECHRKIQRKKEFWLQRMNPALQQHQKKDGVISDKKRDGSMINCFQGTLYYQNHKDSLLIDSVKGRKSSQDDKERSECSERKGSAVSGASSYNEGERINEDTGSSGQGSRKKRVTFGEAECINDEDEQTNNDNNSN